MKYFEKYDPKTIDGEKIKSDYKTIGYFAKGRGITQINNLEDATTTIFAFDNKKLLVENYVNAQNEIPLSTRISYKVNDNFYSVAENVSVTSLKDSSETVQAQPTYEGFVVCNDSVIDLTTINAEYIYRMSQTSIASKFGLEQPFNDESKLHSSEQAPADTTAQQEGFIACGTVLQPVEQ